ncbi:MAG: S41 family peptidase [bacterium]|nr:S41 family peptidase [bacterium]
MKDRKDEDKKIENVEFDLEKELNSKKEEEKIDKVREVVIEKKTGFNYLEVILIMIITLILGGFLGSFLSKLEIKKIEKETDKEIIPSELEEFVKTYYDIKDHYYLEIDESGLLDAGIKGMLEFLDDKYSFYMSPEESQNFNEQVQGKYTGIGVEIQQIEDGMVSISNVFKNTPAYVSGLKVGDIILSVGATNVSGKNASEIATEIKNSDQEQVKISVKRGDQVLNFVLDREEVDIPSVTGEVISYQNQKVGYLVISVFASNTYHQFLTELTKLEGEGIDSLIIDVRGNTGGYLNVVTEISSVFLEKGEVVYQLDTKGIVNKVKDTTKTSRSYPVVVLIDKFSASASEILAAALKESYGAKVVGTYSYGKGTVQTAYQLDSGATVKYTIQKWLTPDGNWINEVGVEPTDFVELDDTYIKNPSKDTDKQLQRALKVLVD